MFLVGGGPASFLESRLLTFGRSPQLVTLLQISWGVTGGQSPPVLGKWGFEMGIVPPFLDGFLGLAGGCFHKLLILSTKRRGATTGKPIGKKLTVCVTNSTLI